jgi:3-oxoacyl-[acyl-carrier-protein] synthase-3
MSASAVLGCGAHRPARVVTNDELAADLGATPAQLLEATGVGLRHRAEPGQGPSDLATVAARDALEQAGAGPGDVDFIVFATVTPDMAFPGPGCFLQDKLGCGTVGALDVRAQCAGFVYALATADRFVRAGKARRVLVCAADVHSSGLDYTPRGVAATPYFGDGAGVVFLGDGSEGGVLATVLHNDPTDYRRFWCEFPSSRHHPARMQRPQYEAGLHHYVLDAPAMAAQAEEALQATLVEVLGVAGVARDAVALHLVHYLDHRVARRAAERAGLPADRVVATAAAAGHVATGGIPIALAEAMRDGRVGRGDLVSCVAFGAGMASGGAVLRL